MHINLIIINHKHVCPNSKSVWIQERELPSNIIIIVHQSRWGRDILRMNCFHFMGGNTSIKNGSRDRVNLVGLWSLGLVPMPVSCEILTVSDSDGEGNGESVRKDCQLRSRKRSKHKQKRRLVNPIDQETRLRCILGRPCWCKRGRCLQQFLPADVFHSLLDYRTSLHSLHKIDQDHCVFGLTSVFWLCLLYGQAIVFSSWALGSWNPRPFLQNQGFASDT